MSAPQKFRKSRERRERAAEKAERAERLKEARADLYRFFKCPICGTYESCLLGVLSHAVSKHRTNLVAKACRHAPSHKHRKRGWRETSLRFVTEG
jgi:transcription elongation factor Elf1